MWRAAEKGRRDSDGLRFAAGGFAVGGSRRSRAPPWSTCSCSSPTSSTGSSRARAHTHTQTHTHTHTQAGEQHRRSTEVQHNPAPHMQEQADVEALRRSEGANGQRTFSKLSSPSYMRTRLLFMGLLLVLVSLPASYVTIFKDAVV